MQLVGGKGGVGKTTCAAALAVTAARGLRRALLVSTDPSPSLGDLLRQRVGPTPRPLRGLPSLHAAEIDAPRLLREWLESRRPALEAIALGGTLLDANDVRDLLDLSLPGVDEIAALLDLARYGRSGSYERVIVDTAPTGHTLRLLGMPSVLRAVAGVLASMRERERAVAAAFGAGRTGGDADRLISELTEDAGWLQNLLRDPARLEVSWVTLAEPMAVEETIDALVALRSADIAVHSVVVNRMTPKRRQPCAWCEERRALQLETVGMLRARLADLGLTPRLAIVDDRTAEPGGTGTLRRIGAEMLRQARRPAAGTARKRTVVRARLPGTAEVRCAVPSLDRSQLVLFGGKGGVGKTTCAAACALEASARAPSRRILLVSTDPAHSLADALGIRLSDVPTQVGRGQLWARELDAAAAFQRASERYARGIDALFDRVARGGAADAPYDRQVLHGLIDLAPPGLDEVAAIADVAQALAGGSDSGFDLIVMDTAPAGHSLRLLETPAVLQDWTRALMRILLKYESVGGIGELGSALLQLSRSLRTFSDLLKDPARTSFVVITRAERLPRVETERLLGSLLEMGVAVPAVVVNAFGGGDCGACRRSSAARERELERLVRPEARPRTRVAVAPAELPPPHGTRRLIAWRRTWRCVPPERLSSFPDSGSRPHADVP